jgi:hypothetical protein
MSRWRTSNTEGTVELNTEPVADAPEAAPLLLLMASVIKSFINPRLFFLA